MNEPERVYDAEVINMSPKGVQLYINKNVLESDRVKAIKIKVQLNSNLLLLAGEIVWRKNYLKGLLYGVSLEKGDTEQIIIEELKKYSKSEGK
ncbi:PilZ domain-containing protein [Halalkalibacter krulwichiae]|nr:PilZ domain-containing protein [Halalkalibacter krulwichiae]